MPVDASRFCGMFRQEKVRSRYHLSRALPKIVGPIFTRMKFRDKFHNIVLDRGVIRFSLFFDLKNRRQVRKVAKGISQLVMIPVFAQVVMRIAVVCKSTHFETEGKLLPTLTALTCGGAH